jgi:hypothetical protein
MKICLNLTCSEVYIGKYFSDTFPCKNVLIEGDALLPFFIYFRIFHNKWQENHEGLKLKGTNLLLVYAGEVVLWAKTQVP